MRDANAARGVLDGRELAQAAELLGLVAGQDVEAGDDGVLRIARRVVRDRLISTVDTEARHGHKSRARTFDGYKTHLSVDPDDELITAVAVTPANAADRAVINELLDQPDTDTATTDTEESNGADAGSGAGSGDGAQPDGFEVYGDSAYADKATLDEQTARGHVVRAKVPLVRNAGGFSKDQFGIDLDAGTARPGNRTTEPTAPSWNARSATSPA